MELGETLRLLKQTYIKENLSFGNTGRRKNTSSLDIQISARCSAEFLYRYQINFRFIGVRILTTKGIEDHLEAISLRVHFIGFDRKMDRQ